jgi:peroxisomal 2,4-dienoyl-CoA reductase
MSGAESSPFKGDILKGKVALITGGGSGIGFEIAKQFLAHGAAGVVIMGRREPMLQQAVEMLEKEGGKALYARGDVRDSDDCLRAVDTAVSHFGRLDVLVNSAAGNFLSTLEDLTPKGFKTVLEIDTMGVFNMASAAFGPLKECGSGNIINITATLHYGATWWQGHPSAAKAAIDSLTRSMALEWGAYNIRVNGIAPGPIADTPGMTKLSGGADPKLMDKMMETSVPLGRAGSKFEIASSAIYMLCNPYITGQDLIVDGGNWLMKPMVRLLSMLSVCYSDPKDACRGNTNPPVLCF